MPTVYMHSLGSIKLLLVLCGHSDWLLFEHLLGFRDGGVAPQILYMCTVCNVCTVCSVYTGHAAQRKGASSGLYCNSGGVACAQLLLTPSAPRYCRNRDNQKSAARWRVPISPTLGPPPPPPQSANGIARLVSHISTSTRRPPPCFATCLQHLDDVVPAILVRLAAQASPLLVAL